MIRRLSIVGLVLLLSVEVSAQKIKYKDLYFLLSSKKYNEAEPFLKEFLTNPKEVDHPNANFHMGLIFHEKVRDSDILKETEKLITNADSALIYYQYALQYIDEKEVRRNDEYYIAYKRRDVRTGKFGIKLADVQFDIEGKIEDLKKRKADVKVLKDYFTKSKSAYDTAFKKFNAIKSRFPTEKILLLRSEASVIEEIEDLSRDYQIAVDNFNSYKNMLPNLGQTKYNQKLIKKEVLNYDKDGSSEVDMYQDNVEFWDYALWAQQVKSDVNDKILPMKQELITHDQKLKQLLEKVNGQSVAVDNEIPNILSLVRNLNDYDASPMPVLIFNYKDEELRYLSYNVQHTDFRDSSDIVYKMGVINDQVNYIKRLDSLVNILLSINMEQEAQNYKNYVKTMYGNVSGLESYIKGRLDFVIEEKRNYEGELETIIERSRWLISENDSIPLFMVTDMSSSKYIPVYIDSVATSGLYFSGEAPAQGYFASVSNDRIPETLGYFPLDNELFGKDNMDITESLTLSTTVNPRQGDSYKTHFVVLFSPLPEQESYGATLTRFNDDKVAWTKNVVFGTRPLEMIYIEETDELKIAYDMQNYHGDPGIRDSLRLNKDGQVINQ